MITEDIYKNFSCPTWKALPEIDLYMDQVLSLIDKYLSAFTLPEEEIITSSMINNYVKQRLVPPPAKKRYDKTHIAFFMMICVLKRVLSISAVSLLLSELQKSMTPEAIYTEFCRELESAVRNTASGKAITPSEGTSPCSAMRSAVISFANIASAEAVIRALAPKEPEEQPEAKEKKKEKGKKNDGKEQSE